MTSKAIEVSADTPVVIGAYVPPSLKAQLAERAAQQERSVSAELRVAIREHLGLERQRGEAA
jgi:plasmid stability protein